MLKLPNKHRAEVPLWRHRMTDIRKCFSEKLVEVFLSICNFKCHTPAKANVCDGIKKWRLAGMHGGRHILSHRGVLITEEWRDG